MKKKITAIALVVCLVAVAIVGGSLAYFTDTKEATNTFTVGNVSIKLEEKNWDDHGKAEAETVYPGEPLDKDPTVENTGANPCFVRVKVTGLDCLKPAGMITYRTNYTDGKLGEGWELHTDGYFYYNQVLAVGAKTSPLFQQIVIPTDLKNGDAKTEFNVVVTAEAVQAQGARPSWDKPEGDPMYPGVLQMNVEQIAAWFGTCMPAPTATPTT